MSVQFALAGTIPQRYQAIFKSYTCQMITPATPIRELSVPLIVFWSSASLLPAQVSQLTELSCLRAIFCERSLLESLHVRFSGSDIFLLSEDYTKAQMDQLLTMFLQIQSMQARLERQITLQQQQWQDDRLVNRAKLLLISELSFDEQKAHQYILKKAMDLCMKRSEVARMIIERFS